ncbi:MAG: peptidase M28, partial [Planctomycetes bacterium]|nr:peptidase M28 [Planctomycetota bacterium]
MKRHQVVWAVCVVSIAAIVRAEEPVDLQMISRIKAEGLGNSQVMDTLSWLTDVHGPRLTGSPALKAANEWCRDKMAEWGLENTRLEEWGTFGRGWVLDRYSLEMTAPYYVNMIAFPQAWTSGTDGPVVGTPMLIDAEKPEDLEKYKGKLKGAIVMTRPTRQAEAHFEPDAKRYSEQELADLAKARTPGARRGGFSARFAEFRARRAMR